MDTCHYMWRLRKPPYSFLDSPEASRKLLIRSGNRRVEAGGGRD